jgi:hypothetical protein
MRAHGGLTWRNWQVIAAAIHGPFPPAVLYRLVKKNLKLFHRYDVSDRKKISEKVKNINLM